MSQIPWSYRPKTQTRYDSFTGAKSETTEHWIYDADDNFICLMGVRESSVKESAELVVRAVNRDHLFEELVEAIKIMHEDYVHIGYPRHFAKFKDLLNRVRGL